MAITNIVATTTAGVNELRRMNSNLTNGSSTTAITFAPLVALDATEDAGIYTVTTKAFGLAIPITDKDSKYCIIIRNTASAADANVYIKAGNAAEHGASADLKIVAAKSTAAVDNVSETVYVDTAIQLDSVRYMQMTGSWAGKIVILGAAVTVMVAVIKLP